MKRKSLFIIFCITTLTLSACGKKETPVMSNSVETEVETETTTVEETPTEEVETTENLTEEVENTETTENATEEVETTETELPADVDLESEYEEPIKEAEPDYESMTKDERIDAATKDLVDDIMERYAQEQAQQNHIPVDDDDWGRESDGTLANPTGHGQGDYSDVEHIRIN